MVATLLGMIGLLAGFLLIWHVRLCPPLQRLDRTSLSVIIPARNEEHNLPTLLRSIFSSTSQPTEVLVVDDASSDGTAAVSESFGARVLRLSEKPDGWTGKSWACHQGALQARGSLLFFLDADTYFVDEGFSRTISCWVANRDRNAVLSILPYHAMEAVYEQLSLFFNIMMAAGAGGFGLSSQPRLFGQALLISKDIYFAAGGHAAVGGVVLENLRFADLLRRTAARIVCIAGRGALHMRMFPEGSAQMSRSWAKAFVQGAADSGGIVLASAIAWIFVLWSTALMMLLAPHKYGYWPLIIVYLALSMQIARQARQLGNYYLITCLLYPIPLAYYCAIFAQAVVRRAMGKKTIWRGREV